jgi:hypothetical protein
VRAQLIAENLGIVGAALGGRLMSQLSVSACRWKNLRRELLGPASHHLHWRQHRECLALQLSRGEPRPSRAGFPCKE